MNSYIRALQFGAALAIYFGLGPSHDNRADAAAPAPEIYWADTGNKIRRAELDGSNLVTVIDNDLVGNIGDFVIDRRTSLVYINDGFDIFRSNLDGSSLTSIFDFPHSSFRGDITIDPVTNQLFFVDGRNNIIYRSNLDGSNATTIVPASGTPANGAGIRDLWLDSAAGKLYWNYASTLHRTNLDGTQDEALFTSASGIGDFEIDPQQGKIYWTAGTGFQNGGTVRRANLNGSQQEILVSSNLWGVGGIALDLPHGKMYYTDSWSSGPTNYNSTVRMANLNGSSPQTLINLGPSAINLPFEITLDTMIIPEPECGSLVAVACLVVFGSRRNR